MYRQGGEMVGLDIPRRRCPIPARSSSIEEPYLKAKILIPPDYVGAVMELCHGAARHVRHHELPVAHDRVEMHLGASHSAELILDFFDKLKSNTKGYASLDYEFDGYKPSQLVKLDILLSGKPIDALSFIVHKDKALRPRARPHARS